MGTLEGFPNPPALWLRRAKPGYANADDGNAGRGRFALGTRLSPCHPLAVLGLAKPSRGLASAGVGKGEARCGRVVGREFPRARPPPTRIDWFESKLGERLKFPGRCRRCGFV